MHRRPSFLLALAGGLALGGCARYRAAPLDVERPLRPGTAAPTPTSPIAFSDAIRFAVDRNPDLVALRARVRAVNLDPAREPAELGGGVDSDHRGEVGVSLDALSLLGLGMRPYEVALACARREEARLAHHARAREIAGEIAERFAVERALSLLVDPVVDVDVSAFVRAGLESASAETAAAATSSAFEAERALRLAERSTNRIALVRLLGLPSGTDVRFGAVPGDWPPVDRPAPLALAAARADVQRRVAAFEVADREIRRAVQAQYPTVALEPGIVADPTMLFGAVRLRLPVGLAPEVRALEAAREAARADVESALLDAMEQVETTRVRWLATQAVLGAARKRAESAAALLQGARLRLEVSTGSPIETVLSADAVVDAAVGLRTATLDEALARVAAARAAGWPGPMR